jgi:hypothetical protein
MNSSDNKLPFILHISKTRINSVAWVRERTIPPPSDRRLSEKLVPNLRIEGDTWSEWRIPTAVLSDF